MNKFLPVMLIIFLVTACLMTSLLMPWAELGFPAPLAQVARFQHMLVNKLPNSGDPQVFEYYVYSLFLGLALLSGAIAICVAGRQESQEQTVLVSKK